MISRTNKINNCFKKQLKQETSKKQKAAKLKKAVKTKGGPLKYGDEYKCKICDSMFKTSQ